MAFNDGHGSEAVRTCLRRMYSNPERVIGWCLDRIHLSTLASFAFYRQAAAQHHLDEVEVLPLTDNLPVHYERVRQELERSRDSLTGRVSDHYIERMSKGLGHWVEAGHNGYLSWGIMHFRKPAG